MTVPFKFRQPLKETFEFEAGSGASGGKLGTKELQHYHEMLAPHLAPAALDAALARCPLDLDGFFSFIADVHKGLGGAATYDDLTWQFVANTARAQLFGGQDTIDVKTVRVLTDPTLKKGKGGDAELAALWAAQVGDGALVTIPQLVAVLKDAGKGLPMTDLLRCLMPKGGGTKTTGSNAAAKPPVTAAAAPPPPTPIAAPSPPRVSVGPSSPAKPAPPPPPPPTAPKPPVPPPAPSSPTTTVKPEGSPAGAAKPAPAAPPTPKPAVTTPAEPPAAVKPEVPVPQPQLTVAPPPQPTPPKLESEESVAGDGSFGSASPQATALAAASNMSAANGSFLASSGLQPSFAAPPRNAPASGAPNPTTPAPKSQGGSAANSSIKVAVVDASTFACIDVPPPVSTELQKTFDDLDVQSRKLQAELDRELAEVASVSSIVESLRGRLHQLQRQPFVGHQDLEAERQHLLQRMLDWEDAVSNQQVTLDHELAALRREQMASASRAALAARIGLPSDRTALSDEASSQLRLQTFHHSWDQARQALEDKKEAIRKLKKLNRQEEALKAELHLINRPATQPETAAGPKFARIDADGLSAASVPQRPLVAAADAGQGAPHGAARLGPFSEDMRLRAFYAALRAAHGATTPVATGSTQHGQLAHDASVGVRLARHTSYDTPPTHHVNPYSMGNTRR